jgi:hypothetical protein
MAPRSVRFGWRSRKLSDVVQSMGDQKFIILLHTGTGLPYGSHIRRTCYNPPRGPSADWWVLTTANAARTNGLTCLPEHGGVRENKFLVPQPLIDQRCLAF